MTRPMREPAFVKPIDTAKWGSRQKVAITLLHLVNTEFYSTNGGNEYKGSEICTPKCNHRHGKSQ